MLTMQWQGLLSLTFISVLILNSSSELANAASLSLKKSTADPYRGYAQTSPFQAGVPRDFLTAKCGQPYPKVSLKGYTSIYPLGTPSDNAGSQSGVFPAFQSGEWLTKSRTIFADSSLTITKQTDSQNLLQQLNLTVEQRQKINQIHYRYKQQISKKRQNLARLQQQLSDMMVGTEAAESIRLKNQQLVNMRQEIGALRFETMLATREILTLQQRQKFRELVESQQTQ